MCIIWMKERVRLLAVHSESLKSVLPVIVGGQAVLPAELQPSQSNHYIKGFVVSSARYL